MNKVFVSGHLGKDVELRTTQSGQSVCNLSLATNERWTNKDGQKQEHTEWHRVIVWGKTAENCAKYLKKGQTVLVDGKLQTREFDEAIGIKRYVTEIVANTVEFGASPAGAGQRDIPLPEDGPAPASGRARQTARPQASNENNEISDPNVPGGPPASGGSFSDDEIPF